MGFLNSRPMHLKNEKLLWNSPISGDQRETPLGKSCKWFDNFISFWDVYLYQLANECPFSRIFVKSFALTVRGNHCLWTVYGVSQSNKMSNYNVLKFFAIKPTVSKKSMCHSWHIHQTIYNRRYNFQKIQVSRTFLRVNSSIIKGLMYTTGLTKSNQ